MSWPERVCLRLGLKIPCGEIPGVSVLWELGGKALRVGGSGVGGESLGEVRGSHRQPSCLRGCVWDDRRLLTVSVAFVCLFIVFFL